MDGMIQIHQGWFQAAVAGIAVLGLGWRVLSSFELRIEKHMDKLDGRMDKLDGRLADLEKGQAHLQEKVENLRVRLDSIERKLDSGPLGVTSAIMARIEGQMPSPFPQTEPPPPPPQVEGE